MKCGNLTVELDEDGGQLSGHTEMHMKHAHIFYVCLQP